jgi:predicted DNA-binding protein with PD1-like motif
VKSKLLSEQGDRTFAIVFATGDEVAGGLLKFAKQNDLSASHFTATNG